MSTERMAFRAFRHLMLERLGLECPESRQADFRNAMAQVMHALEVSHFETLLDRLEEQDLESPAWHLLREQLTIGETYFFRDPAQLAVIRDAVLRPLADAGRPRRVRLWSAGCATGEEAFTLAILARETLPEELGWSVDILGTDLDPSALHRARAAWFRDWSFRGVDPALRDRWFPPSRGGWAPRPELRSLVRFVPHNLAGEGFEALAEGQGFDLILCRNVLIYIHEATRRAIVDRFLKALQPTGALVMGHNELEPAEARSLHVEHLKDSRIIRPGTRPEPPPARMEVPAAVLSRPARVDAPAAILPRPARAAARPTAPPARATPLEDARRALAGGEHALALDLTRGARGADAIHVAASALANLGRGQEALARVEEGLIRHPMEARLHYLHSLLASELGRDGEAQRALDRTIYLAPGHVAALMDRARAYAGQGRFREAAGDLTHALGSLAGKDPAEAVDGLEPHRVGDVRDRCAELLEQYRAKAGA